MQDSENYLLIDGVTKNETLDENFACLPIERVKSIMSDYSPNGNWSERAVMEIGDISKQFNIQFNLNANIGRLVLCNYPDKLVISSPRDPNNHSGDVSVTKGSFLKYKTVISGDNEKSLNMMSKLNIDRTLGIYGQLNFRDETQSIATLEQLRQLLDLSNGKFDSVITSGSRLGVAGMGHRLAKEYHLKTIGIIPQTVAFKTDPSNFDLLLIKGEDWGDGSYSFGGLANSVIFMGGGFWSFLEYKYAKHFDKKIRLSQNSNLRYSPEFFKNESVQADFDGDIHRIADYLAN